MSRVTRRDGYFASPAFPQVMGLVKNGMVILPSSDQERIAGNGSLLDGGVLLSINRALLNVLIPTP